MRALAFLLLTVIVGFNAGVWWFTADHGQHKPSVPQKEDIYWQRYQRGEYRETGGMSPADLDRIRREAKEESDRRSGAMTGADGRPTYRCPTCGGDVRECGGGGLTDTGCHRAAVKPWMMVRPDTEEEKAERKKKEQLLAKQLYLQAALAKELEIPPSDAWGLLQRFEWDYDKAMRFYRTGEK